MTVGRVYGALAALTLLGGLLTVGPAYAQRRDGGLLAPEQNGKIIAAGCLMKGDQIRGAHKEKYVLARPKSGPVESVPEATCTAAAGADALELQDTHKAGITDAMLGRWIQISGELEKETSKNPDNLREVDLTSARLIPVVPPRVAAAPVRTPPPAVVEQPAPARAPAPAPVPAYEAPKELPKTATPVPAVGLVGMLLLAGGIALRSFRRARE